MLTQLGTLALALLPAFGVSRPATTVYRPRIEVWTNRGDAAVYTRGDGVRVYFRVEQDAYVTLFRVDTDGRVRVLFPREPWEDNFVRGGREFEAEGGLSRDAFYIDDYPGVGYVFAVAGADPFVYDPISSGDHWDYRVIADGRVRGDPYVALTDLAQRIVPEGYTDWDYDIVSYGVERHYDYPRFLCYDCHAYASYPLWNPYSYSCVRFRIVMFDDPWYYPYRYYGGTRVVFVRPFRPEPRFIFKTWGNGESRDRFVTRERQRPVNDDTRRGVRGRDLGGVGAIPAPRETGGRRERPANDGSRDRPQVDPSRGEPRRDAPQAEPRREAPRGEPRGEPGRDPPQRVEPRRDPPRETGREWTPPRTEPRRDPPPRVEPRRESPPSRAEPRRDPPQRAEPRRESPAPRAEPRRESPPPRAEPRRESPPRRSEPKREPELRRRKPS